MWRGKWLLLGIGMISALSAAKNVDSATLIESKGSAGEVNMIWLEGAKMRAQEGRERGYMLFNADTKKMYSISPDTREVIDMSENLRQHRGAGVKKPPLDLVFNSKGKGPVIAGYETELFEILANGKKCGEEYLSTKALADVGSIEAFEVLAKLDAAVPPDYPLEKLDPCTLIADEMAVRYRKHGLPLRGHGPNGEVDSDVVRIVKDAPLPSGGFELPKDFRVVTLNELMEEEAKAAGAPPPDFMSTKDINSEEMQKKLQEMLQQMEKGQPPPPPAGAGKK